MRIAFLDSWLQNTADGSGTAAAIGGLRAALIARGHTVARLAPPTSWPALLTPRRLLFNLQLPALLRTLRYDLVVGFDIDGFGWSGRGDGTPYLASIKGVIAEELRHERGRIRRQLWALSRLERHNARNADAVLTTSAYCRTAIARHYGVAEQHVRIVPEGIDLDRWRRIAGPLPRARDHASATILCVARQYPRKHIADLLRALPSIRQAVPQVRAIVVGDGPEHGALRQLADDLKLGSSVQLLGGLPDDEQVARLYGDADVFCLPSVQEGFGIVFLEALASGLPIVATNAAAIPEVVPHERAGLLVRPGDSAALAAALVTLLRNPDQRAAYGRFGMDYVQQYDWGRVAERFISAVTPFVRR
jgi:glycosyltransferase involved in cell wall biosynthesis